jgi:hypothetical protein
MQLFGHGGVALTDDICVLSLGNLSAHFAIYQPQTRKSKEFCEDIPDASSSVFVIDFVHDVLRDMAVDFRIVRDINNVGLSARWEDFQAIEDLQQATIFYQAPQQYINGSIKLNTQFDIKGSYIGVITAVHPKTAKVYKAVFPFRVGNKTFWDYLPAFILLLILLEAFYWISSGGLDKLKNKNALKLA